jgi:hypothetical protein
MLTEARALVTSGWCQGTSARAAGHEPVVPWADNAQSWSAMGALACSWHRRRSPDSRFAADDPVHGSYVVAATAFTHVVQRGPQSWNDDARRRQDDVVAALDAAVGIVAAAALDHRGAPASAPRARGRSHRSPVTRGDCERSS